MAVAEKGGGRKYIPEDPPLLSCWWDGPVALSFLMSSLYSTCCWDLYFLAGAFPPAWTVELGSRMTAI
jgi:hypothetical protein